MQTPAPDSRCEVQFPEVPSGAESGAEVQQVQVTSDSAVSCFADSENKRNEADWESYSKPGMIPHGGSVEHISGGLFRVYDNTGEIYDAYDVKLLRRRCRQRKTSPVVPSRPSALKCGRVLRPRSRGRRAAASTSRGSPSDSPSDSEPPLPTWVAAEGAFTKSELELLRSCAPPSRGWAHA